LDWKKRKKEKEPVFKKVTSPTWKL